jgi:hypothetical protein
MGSFIICTHHQISLGRSNNVNEVGGACGTRGRWESPKESDHLKDRDVDGRMRLEWMLGSLTGECGVDSAGSG